MEQKNLIKNKLFSWRWGNNSNVSLYHTCTRKPTSLKTAIRIWRQWYLNFGYLLVTPSPTYTRVPNFQVLNDHAMKQFQNIWPWKRAVELRRLLTDKLLFVLFYSQNKHIPISENSIEYKTKQKVIHHLISSLTPEIMEITFMYFPLAGSRLPDHLGIFLDHQCQH